MRSLFHLLTLGHYSPEQNNIALDYGQLHLDPLKAQAAMIHEQSHNVLSNITDYGLATIFLSEISKVAKANYKKALSTILLEMANRQRTTQESLATFIEMQMIRRYKGKRFVYEYAVTNLPNDYQDRFYAVQQIFESSRKYRDFFTSKIPVIAMQNGFRTRLVESGAKNIRDLEEFVVNDKEAPDKRYATLLKVILKQPSLMKKTPQEICEAAKINYYEDAPKKEVSDFLNWCVQFTDASIVFKPSDVKDGKDLNKVMSSSGDEMLISNLNMDFVTSSEILFERRDIVHYKDEYKAIMISGMGDDIEGKSQLEQYWKRKFEANLIGFTDKVSKYMYPNTFSEITNLIETEFKDIPLLVKWGLYKPNGELLIFKSKRLPDVVIYNTPQNLIDAFDTSIKKSVEYLHIGASPDHPFQLFLAVDENEVIHYLNCLPVGISKIKSKLKNKITEGRMKKFLNKKEAINASWGVWSGLDFGTDWFGNLHNIKQ